MKHAVIYIPGLGDARIGGQLLAVKTWHWYGVHAELFQKNWIDGERFEPKFLRLLHRIDELAEQGYAVSIVAASAGASAAINAYAARPDTIHAVVCIAGEINGRDRMHPSVYQNNPAFRDSMHMIEASLPQITPLMRERILSRRGALDITVTAKDSYLPGAVNQVVPTMSHFVTIATQILFGAHSFIRFIKSQPARTS
jgi:hypothetical protein